MTVIALPVPTHLDRVDIEAALNDAADMGTPSIDWAVVRRARLATAQRRASAATRVALIHAEAARRAAARSAERRAFLRSL